MYLKRYVVFGLAGLVRAARRLAARAEGHQGAHAAAADRLVRPDRRGDAPGRGRGGERRHALAGRRADPVPALRAAQARRWCSTPPSCWPRGRASTKTIGGLVKPLLIVVVLACALLLKQPDMGTAMVICFAIGALLVAAGTPTRQPGHRSPARWRAWRCSWRMAEPYRRARLTSFLDPFSDAGDSGFQAVQALTALGLGRAVRRGPRRVGAEDLLPARGPHGHDPGDHRRGARPGGDPGA